MQMSVLTFLLSRQWNAKKINLFSILSISIVRGRGGGWWGLIVEERKCLDWRDNISSSLQQCSSKRLKGLCLMSQPRGGLDRASSPHLPLLSQILPTPGPAQPAAQSWIWAKTCPLCLQLQPSFPPWCEGRVGPGHQSLTLGGKYQTWSSPAAR